jgi:predicted RNA-binding Zn-ribbon protein involved in translation (DUF1610 family)
MSRIFFSFIKSFQTQIKKAMSENVVSVREAMRQFENKPLTLVGRHCTTCGLDFFVSPNQSRALSTRTLHCPDCGAQENMLLFSLFVDSLHIVEPHKAKAASAEILAR